jgi:CheY-like chemotaxis protein
MSKLGPLIVVEDSQDDLFFLTRAMGKLGEGPELVTCRDGIDAIELLLRMKDKAEALPAVIVTDIKMPLKSGFDLLQWRREHDWAREIPMVVLSSSDLTKDREQASALGATAYYVKPKDVEHLMGTLREIVKTHCEGPLGTPDKPSI